MSKFFKRNNCMITYEIMTKKTAKFYVSHFHLEGMSESQMICYIDLIETRKNFRNAGQARYALNEFLSEMNKSGVYGVFLFANYDCSYYRNYDNNGLLKLITFYKSFGFEISNDINLKTIDNSCQVDMHRITM